MGKRIVIIGGGAAGIGAAGAAKGTDPEAEVTVFTEYQDAAYSPCGIPYVHGKEIPDFERLFLGTKQQYADQGIDIRYRDAGRRVRPRRLVRARWGDGPCPTTRWSSRAAGATASCRCLAPTSTGLYYIKNIREAMEWDKVLDTRAERGRPRGRPAGSRDGRPRWRTAGSRRTSSTPRPGPCRWRPTRTSASRSRTPGSRWGCTCTSTRGSRRSSGTRPARSAGCARARGRSPARLWWSPRTRCPDTALGAKAGLRLGSTGGFVVDETMQTSVPGVWAAGDCIEVPHGVSNVPVQGLAGQHAYAQGKVAGVNAGGGDRALPAGLRAVGDGRPGSG